MDTAPTTLKKRVPRSLARVFTACTVAAAVAATGFSAGTADARRGPTGPEGPAQDNFISAYTTSVLNPGLMPPDVNDWNCQPSPAHPNPVVLIHGTWDSAYGTWSQLTPLLRQQGYCAYTFNYGDDESGLVGLPKGIYGTQTLRKSGEEVAGFIDEVLARTGADKVDLVGHSQGGIHARLYVQDYGGANPEDPDAGKVDKVIGLGANNHGTSLTGIAAIGQQIQDIGVPVMDLARVPLGDAGIDQAVGSPFFEYFNAEGDTRPGIKYSMIATKYDGIVSPYRTQFLADGPGAEVANITVQDICANDFSEHLSMTFSPNVLAMVLNRLNGDAAGQGVTCVDVLPFTGERGALSS